MVVLLRRKFSVRALALALALHALLAWALVWGPHRWLPPPGAKAPSESEPVLYIRRFTEDDGLRQQQREGEGSALAEEPCAGESYVGIGIVAGSYTGMVLFVAPGAPADRAGIHAGEQIVNAEILGANLYQVGTPLELQVANTAGVRRVVVLKVEKICNA
jgi:hypothetical protein